MWTNGSIWILLLIGKKSFMPLILCGDSVLFVTVAHFQMWYMFGTEVVA